MTLFKEVKVNANLPPSFSNDPTCASLCLPHNCQQEWDCWVPMQSAASGHGLDTRLSFASSQALEELGQTIYFRVSQSFASSLGTVPTSICPIAAEPPGSSWLSLLSVEPGSDDSHYHFPSCIRIASLPPDLLPPVLVALIQRRAEGSWQSTAFLLPFHTPQPRWQLGLLMKLCSTLQSSAEALQDSRKK